MAGPREFDMDEALDAAMSVFWEKGYEGTSMADLMAATGLHKGSIYKAFTDKHDLFVKALKRYLNQGASEFAGCAAACVNSQAGFAAALESDVLPL